jgi:CxC6 like cysteine cluster associated with KDZ transposases
MATGVCFLFFSCTFLHSLSDQITAGVHDGVTVQCLVCSVHDCTEPLRSQKARFCETHSHRNDICYIYGCESSIQPGFSTCGLESHRAHELASREKHTAMFQLKNRLQAHGIPQVPRPGSPPPVLSSPQVSSSASAQPQPTVQSPTPPVKGKNSRSYSHNEQLFVRCCGVVISRATFYGSEGLTGVAVC